MSGPSKLSIFTPLANIVAIGYFKEERNHTTQVKKLALEKHNLKRINKILQFILDKQKELAKETPSLRKK